MPNILRLRSITMTAALAGFGLEVALVGDRPFGSAFAAVAFAALYLGVAAVALSLAGSMLAMLISATVCIAVTTAAMAVLVLLSADSPPHSRMSL